MKLWYRVSGRLPTDEYELAIARWSDLGMAGCEELEVDRTATAVTVYFYDELIARQVADEFRRHSPGTALAVETVGNEDWNARWRETMQPARLADHWWVAPVWLRPVLQPGDHWIKIEPKMAFGTGHHETTRLAAQMMIDDASRMKNAAVLDVGTGSGVLCFVAAMLEAASCAGVEIDPDCRENLGENLRENSQVQQCSFVIGSLEVVRAEQCFRVIVMNMIHTESAPLLGRCRDLLAPNGVLIWSGILHDEYEHAVQVAEEAGFVPDRQTRENEWWCGSFTKKY